MGRTRIKICGITDEPAAVAAIRAGADALGFVFVPTSARFIDPDEAFEIVKHLPPFVTGVGVVQDLSVDDYCDIEEACPCALMQLHGAEPEHVVRQCGPGVMKAIRMHAGLGVEAIVATLRAWDAVHEVDAIMVDGPKAGSGERVDWAVLAEAKSIAQLGKPLVLAGGLTAENVGEAVRLVRPFAVDVSSGVEVPEAEAGRKGVKDAARMAAFCAAVREADRAMG